MTVDFRAVTEAEARIAQAFVEMLTSPEFQAAYYRLIEPSRKVAGAFEQLGRDLARRAADG